MKIRAITLVLVLAALGLSACGSDDLTSLSPPETTTTVPGGVDLAEVEWVDLTGEDEVLIQARDNRFLPSHFIVSAGTTIRFRNVGRTEHNALPVADNVPIDPIEVEDFAPQDEVEMVFDEAGEYPYPYYCSLHGTVSKGMVGAVRVVDPA